VLQPDPRPDLEAVEELVRQLAWRPGRCYARAPVFGTMLASLTRSDQRRAGISFGS
jgi:hypothetical protein